MMNLFKVLAKSLGYELVNRNKNPSLMFHLIDLIERNEIDLILDVGANVGQFSKSIIDAGYKGEIHSFEPVKETFEKLNTAAAEHKNWHVHNFAMGDEIGQNEINVTQSSDFSSMLEPTQYAKDRYKNEKNKIEYVETIEINTIDSFLSSNISNLEKRSIFLKTDTQGFDLKVIAGAVKSLNLVRCLLSEVSLIPLYEGMPHYLESLQTFESHGFITTGLYPITRNKINLAVIEMDCVMIKNTIS
ncbi:MAG: FkbM family methyltransferase [Alphaproteobacteria bacterium]|jgi:FkbM family methyltransferase